MITVSLCMIVKDEEAHLKDCVASLNGFYDELVVVDTGSTDRTKEIAHALNAKVFDFPWCDDFAAARNFAFSKCTCDYIYSADADERLDEENLRRLLMLKEAMDPQVEVVQMWYAGQLAHETVYNFDRELRPKLFKRVRTFVWEGAIHEQVRTEALVFDSDVEIRHLSAENHAPRDLRYFRAMTKDNAPLSARLHDMYARELCKAGTAEDFAHAVPYFESAAEDAAQSEDGLRRSFYVLAHAARVAGDTQTFFKYALRDAAMTASAEICCELGAFFREKKDAAEACMWYYNAAYEAEACLDIRASGEIPLQALIDISEETGNGEQAEAYRRALADLHAFLAGEREETC